MALTPEQKARKAENDKARRERNKLGKPSAPTMAAPPTPKALKAPGRPAKVAHGGAREGSGAPRSPNAMVLCTFRCSPEQLKKARKLGMGVWFRERIDKAIVPAKK